MSEWGKVPKDAFTDGRLTRTDVRVLGILCAHANGKTGLCTRKQGLIAGEIEVTRETVNRSLRKLERLGYVRPQPRPGMKRSLDYRVLVSDGSAGQLGLFDAGAAPRQAREKVRKPRPKRDQKITAVVTSEITSVVTSDVTPIEQTLVNRGPVGPAAHASSVDLERDADAALPGDAVPLVRPVGRAKDFETALRDAAGEAINAAHPAFLNLAEPYGWLAAGCDVDLDVLPTVRGLAARHRGPPLRSWRYFTGAVTEARDRRLAAARPGAAPPPHAAPRPPKLKSVGDRVAEAMGRIARGEEAFPMHDDERTIDVTAQRH